jgi:hypothetical protein
VPPGRSQQRELGDWKSAGDVEIGIAEYVNYSNHRRCHIEIGLVPPPSSSESLRHQHAERYPETPVPTGAGSA